MLVAMLVANIFPGGQEHLVDHGHLLDPLVQGGLGNLGDQGGNGMDRKVSMCHSGLKQ
jgi:hypothetical protein